MYPTCAHVYGCLLCMPFEQLRSYLQSPMVPNVKLKVAILLHTETNCQDYTPWKALGQVVKVAKGSSADLARV